MKLKELLLINKPVGISSYDCVRKLKTMLPANTKIGYAGTLDPFASGLMIMGLGNGTKLLHTLEKADKKYSATAQAGLLTDTLDNTGQILENNPTTLDRQELITLAHNLMPQYEQVPPVYSNLKYNGERLRLLARAGTDYEELLRLAATKKRQCFIYDLEIDQVDQSCFTFHVHVSSGCYIRSLANDITMQKNIPSTLVSLKRTAIGQFDLQQSLDLETISADNLYE